jgi:hypothetical protein
MGKRKSHYGIEEEIRKEGSKNNLNLFI